MPSVRHKITTLKESKALEIKEAEYAVNLEKTTAILTKYNSPFKDLGYILVQKTQECGGDYRVLLAIAGNESGFGRIPYKLYNPFGYLNGVQYSGWEEALSVISCKIAKEYLVPCNNSPECIVRRYAGEGDDKEKWVRNIYWFINQI